MRLAVGSPECGTSPGCPSCGEPARGYREPAPCPGEPALGTGIQPQRCGEPAWAVGIQPWARESSPKVWEASPGRGAAARAVGSQPWGQGCSPKVWGASPPQLGAPVVAVPGAGPPPRQGAQCLCSPRTPALFSHTSQWWWVFGGSCTTNILGRWTALQLCRELFEGEQREQRIHLVLGAGSEGRCPLRQQGQTSRTCLVTPLSPCSWSRQFSNPPQCSSSFSSPAPGNARRATSWGLPQLLAPGPSEPWSPRVQHAGLCWPQLLLPFPCLLAWEWGTAVWAAAGNFQPWKGPREDCLETAGEWGLLVTAQMTVTA